MSVLPDTEVDLHGRLLVTPDLRSSRVSRKASWTLFFGKAVPPPQRQHRLPSASDERLNMFSMFAKVDWDEEGEEDDGKAQCALPVQWEEARMEAVGCLHRCAYYALSNYASAYMSYLSGVVLIGAAALYCCGGCSLSDALFMSSSSTTQAGLSVINYAEASNVTQFTTFVLMILGSPLLLTVVPLFLRRFAFRSYRDWCVKKQKPLPNEEDNGALVLLILIVLSYWLSITLIGFWLCFRVNWRAEESLSNKSPKIWNALFMSSSAFQNNGLALIPSSLEPLSTQPYALYIMTILIILGNTGIPIFLRIMTALFLKCVKPTREKNSLHRRLIRLLAEPRHFYTHMFSSVHTLWLSLMLFALLAVQALPMVYFDWTGLELSKFGFMSRLANVIFQAASTRTAGLNSIELENLSMPTAFVIIVCMYISTSPVTLTMRTTNVKVQQSLRDQVVMYFTQHMILLSVVILLILMLEQPKTVKISEPCSTSEACDLRANFSFFKLLFELVSAYGTVGLSLGSISTGNSFCSDWTRPSQLLLCLVMLLGRTRDLPLSIDHPFHLEDACTQSDDELPVRTVTWPPE